MPPMVKDGRGTRSVSVASLVGGVIVAIGCFILALLLTGRADGPSFVIAGAIALAVGVYVRVADM